MKAIALPPELDPRRKVGAVSGSASHRPTAGWRSLLVSVGLHVLLIAVSFIVISLGQGSEGEDGNDQEDADAAASAEFVSAPQVSESVKITPRPVKAAKPSRANILRATTSLAEMVVPDWQMQPIAAVVAPAPVPQLQAQPVAASNKASTTQGKASESKRKATGSGKGGGRGDGLIGVKLPTLLRSTEPKYPAEALRNSIEGSALVRVAVSTKGRVLTCAIQKSTGHSALDASALKAVRQWVFSPAARDGVEVLVRVGFRLG
jgi:TonB family protein